MRKLALSIVLSLAYSVSAYALPALQIGNGDMGNWEWEAGTQTWATDSSSFSVNTFANALDARGQYAWDSADSTRTAYLVFAAAPMTADAADVFDIGLSGTSALTFVESGYGAGLLTDPNSLAPHGIYDTYYEVYSFNFDEAIQEIYNVQPGSTTETGPGYAESFNVDVLRLDEGVTGIHMDLYTMDANGQVASFAPFSHDAEYNVPEPSTLVLLGAGLLLLSATKRRKV